MCILHDKQSKLLKTDLHDIRRGPMGSNGSRNACGMNLQSVTMLLRVAGQEGQAAEEPLA